MCICETRDLAVDDILEILCRLDKVKMHLIRNRLIYKIQYNSQKFLKIEYFMI